jgi:hypothetical protein
MGTAEIETFIDNFMIDDSEQDYLNDNSSQCSDITTFSNY